MNLNFVEVKDIQPKNVRCDSNPNNQNKIRRAWVSMLPEEIKAAIQTRLPEQEVRFAYYGSIDNDVSSKWIEIMRRHYSQSIKNGAKVVLDKIGGDRLENDFCVNADEHLLLAAEVVAQEVVDAFSQYVKINPELNTELN